jgi:hypothetical protein
MNARRPELVTIALSLAGWAVAGGAILGCGADPKGSPETGATSADGPGAAPGETADALGPGEVTPRFSVDGRGESGKTSTVLQVFEGEGITLSITGADASDNIIVISVGFENVEGVVGTHTLPIGVVDERVFAVGSVDGQAYQSVSGELELQLSADRRAQGHFDVALGREQQIVISAPDAPSAPAPGEPTEELTLSGTFESQWTLNCYSRLRGFTGSHLVSDSPYCNSLTFE